MGHSKCSYPASSMQNIRIVNSWFMDLASSSLSLRGVSNSRFVNNYIWNTSYPFTDKNKTSVFNWTTKNISFLNNYFKRIDDTSDNDQGFIDNEAYCTDVKIRGTYFDNAAGPAVEFLLGGSGWAPLRIPSEDYNTNNSLQVNTFLRNGENQEGPSSGFSATIHTGDYNANMTANGGVYNNLWHQKDGVFTNNNSHADWSGFTFGGNNQITVITDLYNAARQFTSTQGSDQWYYQYPNGVSYSNLTWNATKGAWTEEGARSASADLTPIR